MNKFLILFLLIVASPYAFSQHSGSEILGYWTEYWYPTGSETDVTYTSTMRISMDESGDLQIECTTESYYVCDDVTYEDGILTFRAENQSDPNEKFYVYYSLVVLEDHGILKGGIVNSRNSQNKIKWSRVYMN